MIRIGQYDTFDKWKLLCRHWEDPASLPDLGFNKFEQPRLATWRAAALQSGARACVDYIRARENGVASPLPDQTALLAAAAKEADRIHDEVSTALQQLGYPEFQRRVLAFAEAIANTGIGTAADSSFSPELADRLKEVFKAGALKGLQWTCEINEIPTIEILQEQAAAPFPTETVRDKKKVLSLFSAKFYGRSDIIHIHSAEPDDITLVDLDQEALEDMKAIYPAHWTYLNQDYQSFLKEADAKNDRYDLIMSDPFRAHGRPIAWDLLHVIRRLCTNVFITNYFSEMFEELAVSPDNLPGLSQAIYERTGVNVKVEQTLQRSRDVHWVVMQCQENAPDSN